MQSSYDEFKLDWPQPQDVLEEKNRYRREQYVKAETGPWLYKLRDTYQWQQPPEARKETWNKNSPSEPPGGTNTAHTFQLSASRSQRE